MKIKVRSLFWMFILNIVTLGIYEIYWTVKTKNEIKSLGADIPSAFLLFIPGANLYFWYKYAEGFTTFVKKDANLLSYFFIGIFPYLVISLFGTANSTNPGWPILLNALSYYIKLYFKFIEFGFIPMLVFQMELNKFAKQNQIAY